MKNEIFEVVSEFKITVDGLDHPVHGRIIRKLKAEDEDEAYTWEVSHYCKQFKDALGAYTPSNNWDISLQLCQFFLGEYLELFTEMGIMPNVYY